MFFCGEQVDLEIFHTVSKEDPKYEIMGVKEAGMQKRTWVLNLLILTTLFGLVSQAGS